MREHSPKKRREKMAAWLKSEEGKAYVKRFRERTPEDAAEVTRILTERKSA